MLCIICDVMDSVRNKWNITALVWEFFFLPVTCGGICQRGYVWFQQELTQLMRYHYVEQFNNYQTYELKQNELVSNLTNRMEMSLRKILVWQSWQYLLCSNGLVEVGRYFFLAVSTTGPLVYQCQRGRLTLVCIESVSYWYQSRLDIIRFETFMKKRCNLRRGS